MNEVQKGDLILYQSDNGEMRIEVKLIDETIWLSLTQMANIFDRDKSLISKHISNIFEEGELDSNRTTAKFATVQREGLREIERLNDERLKNASNIGSDYFEEMLERIKDIRSSEKRFYQKIRDIYKLAVDYDSKSEETLEFFKIVQNKLHFAISGKTAAELMRIGSMLENRIWGLVRMLRISLHFLSLRNLFKSGLERKRKKKLWMMMLI
jgi:hypothetical protein